MNIAEETRNIIALEALADEAKRIAAGKRDALAIEARRQLTDSGVAPSWAVPEVAKVTLGLTKTAAFVADEAKLTAWMEARHPARVETTRQIRSPFLTQFLSGLAHEGEQAVDRETGEIVPGVAVRKGGQPASLSIKAEPEVKRTIAATVGLMLATAHPAIVGAREPDLPAVAEPWIPAGDPFAAFPAAPAGGQS